VSGRAFQAESPAEENAYPDFGRVGLLMELRLTATECHFSYKIRQCYLAPDKVNKPTWMSARQAGGMEGWVDL